MNMISTGAFQTEVDASDKQETLVAKLVSAWERKNAKVARAGGVSLMALSLAACGSDDDDVAVATPVTPVTPTVVDTDGDGMIDSKDAFPNDAAETTDTDGDGIGDNADAYPNDATNTPPAPVNQNLVLTNTANQTTGGADNLTGGDGDDTFLAMAAAALDNGDVLDGGAGTDKITARYSVDAAKTVNTSITNIEKVLMDFDDGDATGAHVLTVNTSGFTGLTDVGTINADSVNGAKDTTNFINVAVGVDINVENGDAHSILDVDYVATSVTGTTDVADVHMTAGLLDTLRVAGIETINFNAISGTNAIDTVTTTAATKITISGAGKLTLTNLDDATKTIDASAATGNVTLDGIGAVTSVITGGSGDDTIKMGTTLTALDTVAGGAGNDTLVVGNSQTAALAKVTGIETVELAIANSGNGVTNTISGKAIASATKFIVNQTANANNNDVIAAVSNVDNGDEISIKVAGSDSTTLADGVAVSITQAADTTADAYTLSFEGIGAVTADTTNDTGVGDVSVDSVEVLTINANKNAALSVATNGVEELSVQAATTLDINGAAAIDFDSVVNTTKLTSIDATGLTGKLTMDGIDASAITIKAGSADTVLSLAGLNSSDQIVGGAGTKDYVTASAITGLTATTGKLNIQDVETVELNSTGANTIDASLMTGVTALAISGATPGNQTITGLAASGVSVSAGDITDEFDGNAIISIALADETGAADSATVIVDNRGGAATDVDIKSAATLENITLSVADLDTGNNAAVTMTQSKAESLTVTGGFGGAVLTLGTLAAETTTVDVSGYLGEVTFTAGATTTGMTVTASSSAGADAFVLSGKGDTITVGATGAVDVDVNGGAGTDTLNLTTTSGFIDTSEINGVENINFTLTAGTDVTLGGNAADTDGMDDAAKVTIGGGNELSTFKVSATDALAGTTLLSIDGSSFEGNLDLQYAADKLLATMDIKGGKLTTDAVRALYDTAASLKPKLSNVETLMFTADSGGDDGENYTLDLSGSTGLTNLTLVSDGNINDYNVTEYTSGITVQLGEKAGNEIHASSNIDVVFASAAGAADELKLHLVDTEDTGSIDIDAAGVETLTITDLSTAAESHTLDLAGIAASTGSNTAITITGGVATDGLTISNVSTSVNSIDASAYVGAITISDRASTATTITTGTDTDTVRMENANDVIDTGTGADTLNVNTTMVVGATVVDLSSATDQITSFNGTANAAIQKGFESINLDGAAGNFGAVITGSTGANTITGTKNADSITAGLGVDTVKVQSQSGKDVIDLTEASGSSIDTIELNAIAAEALVINGFSSAGTDVIKINAAALNLRNGATDETSDTGYLEIGSASADAAAASGANDTIVELTQNVDAATTTAIDNYQAAQTATNLSTLITALVANTGAGESFDGALNAVFDDAGDKTVFSVDDGSQSVIFLYTAGAGAGTADTTLEAAEVTIMAVVDSVVTLANTADI
jgi:hypothetical protein